VASQTSRSADKEERYPSSHSVVRRRIDSNRASMIGAQERRASWPARWRVPRVERLHRRVTPSKRSTRWSASAAASISLRGFSAACAFQLAQARAHPLREGARRVMSAPFIGKNSSAPSGTGQPRPHLGARLPRRALEYRSDAIAALRP